jgi:hypothetical protein
MRLLNERHLDEIINGIGPYNVSLQENKNKLFFLRQTLWLPSTGRGDCKSRIRETRETR